MATKRPYDYGVLEHHDYGGPTFWQMKGFPDHPHLPLALEALADHGWEPLMWIPDEGILMRRPRTLDDGDVETVAGARVAPVQAETVDPAFAEKVELWDL